jgi:hypothetical protein
MMEFDVRQRARRVANIVAIHPQDETDQTAGSRKRSKNMLSLLCQRRPVDVNKPDILSTRLQAQSTQPSCIQRLRTPGRRFARAHRLDCRVIVKS